MLQYENWVPKMRVFEFTNLPPSFFEKTGPVEAFLEKKTAHKCYLEAFDFCVLANEAKCSGTQKLIFRNLVVVTLRLCFFYYRHAELPLQEAPRDSSSSSPAVADPRELRAYCRQVCEELARQNIDRFLFSYLNKAIDDTLKTTMVEILNLMDTSKFKPQQMELVFRLMQEAREFTKGKNELVYGNMLLILTNYLHYSSMSQVLLRNFGTTWVYELFEMLLKNTERNVASDSAEQREKDILNCCFVHFICNFDFRRNMIDLDNAKLLSYAQRILHFEVASNPPVSPPLEIEKSYLGQTPAHLLSFLKDARADSLQYFRILNYLGAHLDGTRDAKHCFRRSPLANQKDLYTSSFDQMRDIIADELAFFPAHSPAATASSNTSPTASSGQKEARIDADYLQPVVVDVMAHVSALLSQQVDFFHRRKYGRVHQT